MKIDFSLEITSQNIDAAVASFDTNCYIEDLTPSYALEYILAEVCQFDSLSDADKLINNMNSEHKKMLLDSFFNAYSCIMKEKIKERLRS